ncbi:ABC-ATPase domain-containing protein [Corynebacterium pseudodiphtheriticum]|uniref:ABC-ATPase domain-containing protein n=1 Tax=Corynebacterium pseudodiphtheriticum TaxID=37637 RepID=UPI00254BD356|nr:ABC-ATPase domain-containing protein [Corynebacterium pseudodiphtheriticum]MDK8699905.1 ABC-ATPase domain-containing protein [Corynebacterium pseudodiphtheriticum]
MSLARLLTSLDSAGYGAYKKLHGSYELGEYRLRVDKVQSDPFAPPSLMQVDVPNPVPAELAGVAARDFLTRRIAQAFSGDRDLHIDQPGQQVLDRASVVLDDGGGSAGGSGNDSDTATLRIEVQLPARGRKILGRKARALLCDVLPAALDQALDFPADDLRDAVLLERDQNYLREQLPGRGLIAFIGDGSCLPRAAGHRDTPAEKAVPFRAPDSLRTTFQLPSGREVAGMGVPAGVTVIVGGGYHGKSTLLKALERGVYNHVAGDGREFAITVDSAASLRAEDGRAITGVDISQFISNLPAQTDTTSFSTDNASGSTSQAAGLMEALEAGASTLLIDEDTSATNFMIRDERMRELIPTEKEPITPLVDRVRGLAALGVSTVLVAGGSAAFIDVADTVIHMDSYHPYDITERAAGLARAVDKQEPFPKPAHRPLPAKRFRAKKPPQAKGAGIRVGKSFIDLSAVSQLVDGSQTRAIAAILDSLSTQHGESAALVDEVLEQVKRGGIDAVSRFSGGGTPGSKGKHPGGASGKHPGRLALPRKLEIMAAINRARA